MTKARPAPRGRPGLRGVAGYERVGARTPPDRGDVVRHDRGYFTAADSLLTHWETQMSLNVGIPSVESSLSPMILDPWAWAIPV